MFRVLLEQLLYITMKLLLQNSIINHCCATKKQNKGFQTKKIIKNLFKVNGQKNSGFLRLN